MDSVLVSEKSSASGSMILHLPHLVKLTNQKGKVNAHFWPGFAIQAEHGGGYVELSPLMRACRTRSRAALSQPTYSLRPAMIKAG